MRERAEKGNWCRYLTFDECSAKNDTWFLTPSSGLRVYNVFMWVIAASTIVALVVIRPGLLTASDDTPPPQPSAQERLEQVLTPEGGIHVYKDQRGIVKNTIMLPNGERIIAVQPPQDTGLNLGPPLQLNNQPLQLPSPAPSPAQPPAPEFPQRAR